VEAAEIGRFFPEGTRRDDPLANKFPAWSPYNYTMNNPVNMVDPDGRLPFAHDLQKGLINNLPAFKLSASAQIDVGIQAGGKIMSPITGATAMLNFISTPIFKLSFNAAFSEGGKFEKADLKLTGAGDTGYKEFEQEVSIGGKVDGMGLGAGVSRQGEYIGTGRGFDIQKDESTANLNLGPVEVKSNLSGPKNVGVTENVASEAKLSLGLGAKVTVEIVTHN
jgi:hypothetical protein